jgi:adenylylsulfate kinase
VTGAVVWFTGPPASGKTTLAQAVRSRLAEQGAPVCVLDGDEVRAALVPRPGYDAIEREQFYATLAGLAALLARQGMVALVAATAHRRAFREAARALAPRFVEVYVAASVEQCESRDIKHLYENARAGRLHGLPGLDVAYEAPERPDVVAAGGFDQGAVGAIIAALSSAKGGASWQQQPDQSVSESS